MKLYKKHKYLHDRNFNSTNVYDTNEMIQMIQIEWYKLNYKSSDYIIRMTEFTMTQDFMIQIVWYKLNDINLLFIYLI